MPSASSIHSYVLGTDGPPFPAITPRIHADTGVTRGEYHAMP